MASFNDTLNALVNLLKTDSGLGAWVKEEWKRPLTVMRVWKPRTEVNLAEFPIILVTRPGLKKSFVEGSTWTDQTVMLYFGFIQDSRELAQKQLIEFEEKLNDLLLGKYDLPDSQGNATAENTVPGDSINDEGAYHPAYFGVMPVIVQHKR